MNYSLHIRAPSTKAAASLLASGTLWGVEASSLSTEGAEVHAVLASEDLPRYLKVWPGSQQGAGNYWRQVRLESLEGV